jgi:hypothetical protein
MFARAAELDPHYARAYAGIAECDAMLHAYHHAEVSVDGLLTISARALALAPNLAEVQASRGVALQYARKNNDAMRSSSMQSRSTLTCSRPITSMPASLSSRAISEPQPSCSNGPLRSALMTTGPRFCSAPCIVHLGGRKKEVREPGVGTCRAGAQFAP